MDATLRSARFRREREAAWAELERLTAEAERRGVTNLPAESLARLPVLYRAAVSSLSVARAISLDANLLAYLESLAARAYLVVYGVRRSLREVLAQFFVRGFPLAVRRLRTPLLVAAGVLVLGALLGYGLVAQDSESYYAIVPEGLAAGRTPASSAESLREGLYDRGEERAAHAAFASFLFAHNTQVGLLAFCVGLLGGLPTLALLLVNGLILGAMAQVHHEKGLALDLWGWLLPHGVPELTAVALCGGAGLALAAALLNPGDRLRADALVEAGRSAGTVIVGAVLMLLVAGLIEGIFRQRVHSVPVRYAVALAGTLAIGLWMAAPWLRRAPAGAREEHR